MAFDRQRRLERGHVRVDSWRIGYRAADARPSGRVEIVEAHFGQHHPLATKGNRLGFEQTPLTGSFCQRSVSTDHAMPWDIVCVGVAQHVTR